MTMLKMYICKCIVFFLFLSDSDSDMDLSMDLDTPPGQTFNTVTIVDDTGEIQGIQDDSSDSDSDASPKKPKPFVPLWARTPNLKRTLTNQVNVDPDQIFSEPPAPNLKEIMKSKYDLARTRAVSGIESGVDLEKMDTLSTQEQLEYKRAMGFF
ncbi:hypothetical protein BC833DRAFT_183026 [Globomyces pollinis-pini]|nr:hypothetical protein BC833DRAFT_183026 [Globomyces pollinis-pini]